MPSPSSDSDVELPEEDRKRWSRMDAKVINKKGSAEEGRMGKLWG
jgi:hypothetical protein